MSVLQGAGMLIAPEVTGSSIGKLSSAVTPDGVPQNMVISDAWGKAALNGRKNLKEDSS